MTWACPCLPGLGATHLSGCWDTSPPGQGSCRSVSVGTDSSQGSWQGILKSSCSISHHLGPRNERGGPLIRTITDLKSQMTQELSVGLVEAASSPALSLVLPYTLETLVKMRLHHCQPHRSWLPPSAVVVHLLP